MKWRDLWAALGPAGELVPEYLTSEVVSLVPPPTSIGPDSHVRWETFGGGEGSNNDKFWKMSPHGHLSSAGWWRYPKLVSVDDVQMSAFVDRSLEASKLPIAKA